MQPSAEAVYRKPLCQTAAVTRSEWACSSACKGVSSPPLPIAHDLREQQIRQQAVAMQTGTGVIGVAREKKEMRTPDEDTR
jgi:hypothetical protein